MYIIVMFLWLQACIYDDCVISTPIYRRAIVDPSSELMYELVAATKCPSD